MEFRAWLRDTRAQQLRDKCVAVAALLEGNEIERLARITSGFVAALETNDADVMLLVRDLLPRDPDIGLPENRVGALEAERRAIARVLETGEAKPVTKEVPTIEEFHKVFLATSAIINKPSSVDSKEKLLRFHIVPRLGKL